MSIFKKKNKAEESGDTPKFRIKKSTKKKKIIIAIVLLLVVVAAFYWFRGGEEQQTMTVSVREAKVTRGNLAVTLTGSGTIEANEQREITSLVKGDIKKDFFEENDVVEKDTVLYQIDPDDIEKDIADARDDLKDAKEKHQDNLADKAKLTITAPISGVISEVSVDKGDNVNNGTAIVTIQDNNAMLLTIEFNSSDRNSLYLGAPATVQLESSSITYSGTVQRIASGSIINKRGVSVVLVDIAVSGINNITPGATATAIVNNVACNNAGTFSYNDEQTVKAQVQGEISALNVKKGDKVSAGSVIAILKSDSLDDTVKNSENAVKRAQRNLESLEDTKDDYEIKAPISGTIIQKNSKAGDKLDNSIGSTAMAIIADLSVIKFTLSVDELDITKIQLNQKASITADALPGKRFDGYVSKISTVGTTTNGVTTYPITIIVNNPEGLIPGMNVEASIVTQSVENALLVPTTALNRGNTVWVKKDSKSAKNGKTVKANQNLKNPELYEGYVQVQVETGMSNDAFIEIVSGLEEGDDILITTIVIEGNNNQMMPGFHGGMGGMPGGMGGGMPSGGFGGGSGSRPSGGGMPSGGTGSRPSGGGMPSGGFGGNRGGSGGGMR